MAQTAGLAASLVALASLFSTCVECFDYYKASQTFDEDYEILLVKLDLEKTRLLIWGDHVGIVKAEDEGRSPELRTHGSLVKKTLEQIKNLLADADKIQDHYGLQSGAGPEPGRAIMKNPISHNSMNIFMTTYRRFCVRFSNDMSRPGVLSRTRWAIRDKTKFEGLIINLKDFIDKLIEIILVRREVLDKIVRSDIATILDLSMLRLVESACDGSYPSYFDVARTIIESSELRTIDRRNMEEALGNRSWGGGDRIESTLQTVADSQATFLSTTISFRVAFQN